MRIAGTSIWEWAGILFIGLGPIRTTLAYMPLSRNLPPDIHVRLAVRTVTVGAIIAILIVLLGGGVARTFAVRDEMLLIAAGLAFASRAFNMLAAAPSDESTPPAVSDPMRLAISPLAVPSMIGPVGVVALFIVAMSTPGIAETLAFLGIVVFMLLLDLGAMLLSRHVSRYVTVPLLEVVQQIFGILILALSVRLVFEALVSLELLTVR